jgi:hypothetical protein
MASLISSSELLSTSFDRLGRYFPCWLLRSQFLQEFVFFKRNTSPTKTGATKNSAKRLGVDSKTKSEILQLPINKLLDISKCHVLSANDLLGETRRRINISELV